MVETKGSYFYFFPTYKQGKKILWDGMDNTGFKFLDHFPRQIVAKKNDTEMKIELTNGSVFQVIGTDNFDAIRGTNPVFCVFTEYAFQDPRAWDTVRPILDANGGTAIFNTTPNGENHAYDLFEKVKDDELWFTQLLTINDTGAVPLSAIEQARKEGVDEDTIQREYFCSFGASVQGAYYAPEIRAALADKRITNVPFDASTEVHTFWDLGMDDSTTIWFMQRIGRSFAFIDYYENSGEGISHYVDVLKEKQKEGYSYGKHYFPHDVEVRELGSGKSRKQTLVDMGVPASSIKVVPRISDVGQGIQAVRSLLHLCWFDEKKCRRGLNALKNYRKKYDEENKTFMKTALHDWSSHGSDAFRTFATGWRDEMNFPALKGIRSFDIYD